jgi:two-component system alkaline phosphatase synthesis response regulator PhoP
MSHTPPNILIVDDEQAVRDLLVYNLSKAHFCVLAATNGCQALDLMLSEVDGLYVCR